MPDQRDPTKEEIDALVAAAKAVYGIALECCHPTSDVFEWATLLSGENCRPDFLGYLFVVGHYHSTTRATQGFVGGGGDSMGMLNW